MSPGDSSFEDGGRSPVRSSTNRYGGATNPSDWVGWESTLLCELHCRAWQKDNSGNYKSLKMANWHTIVSKSLKPKYKTYACTKSLRRRDSMSLGKTMSDGILLHVWWILPTEMRIFRGTGVIWYLRWSIRYLLSIPGRFDCIISISDRGWILLSNTEQMCCSRHQ